MRPMIRTLLLVHVVVSCLCLPRALDAQSSPPAAPVIDTIIVVTDNVFTEAEASESFVFRTLNRVRFSTRDYVVKRELLFQKGERFDSVRAAETERNLRARDLFRLVEIDTTRLDDKFAVIVHTKDGWSSKLRLDVAAASDGTLTGLIGVTESNFVGTGNLVHVGYRKEVDRDGLQLSTEIPRVFGSRQTFGASFLNLSDGTTGNWRIGRPFRAFEDRWAIVYSGEAADRRVLRFRTVDPSAPDTTFFQRRAFVNRVTGAFAERAEPTHFLRIGFTGEVRREEYLLQRDTGLAIPDTVKGELGLFVDYRRARFSKVRFHNGFQDEDLDLSTRLALSARFAPSAFGYDRTGVGPRVVAATATRLPHGFIKGTLVANGLFNAAGLDSGRVVASLSVGNWPARRHTTLLHVEGGIQESPTPGEEFDLGFHLPPRAFKPHSFTGTRMIWGTLEHRWFVWDKLLNLIDLGFAAFIDYGGAWFADQSSRFGGAIGIGLRQGSSLSTGVQTGRLDLAYRFGDGILGSRWVISIGPGLIF